MGDPVPADVPRVDVGSKSKLNNEAANFFRLLHEVTVSDPSVLKYRVAMERIRKKKREIMAKAEAECKLLDDRLKVYERLETDRVVRIRQVYMRKRRKELGLPSIKTEQIHAR